MNGATRLTLVMLLTQVMSGSRNQRRQRPMMPRSARKPRMMPAMKAKFCKKHTYIYIYTHTRNQQIVLE